MSATSYNSLAEAGNAAGVNKSTILKAIKRGIISANRTDAGGWQIEPAELHRVFAPVAATKATPVAVHKKLDERLVDELRARVTDAQEQIADLRQRLTQKDQKLDEVNARIAAILTDQRPARSWWSWRK